MKVTIPQTRRAHGLSIVHSATTWGKSIVSKEFILVSTLGELEHCCTLFSHTTYLSILGNHHTIQACKRGTKKCINSWQNIQKWLRFSIFYAKRGTDFQTKCTSTSCQQQSLKQSHDHHSSALKRTKELVCLFFAACTIIFTRSDNSWFNIVFISCYSIKPRWCKPQVKR